jgi:hypothetical protein
MFHGTARASFVCTFEIIQFISMNAVLEKNINERGA